jgi:hypothetical protein
MNEAKSKIDEVKELVSKEFSVKVEKLSNQTRLSHDLGMDGDDAWDFIEVFSKHFQVDMAEFEFRLYFGEEAGADPITLIYFLMFKSARPKFIPITIVDLASSADQKKWIRPNAEAYA